MNTEHSHGSYKEQLFDKRWKEKRERILKRDGFKCVICGKSAEKLIVHHKQYHFNVQTNKKAAPWEYDDRYLITVCESCHTRGHSKYEIPTKNINSKKI